MATWTTRRVAAMAIIMTMLVSGLVAQDQLAEEGVFTPRLELEPLERGDVLRVRAFHGEPSPFRQETRTLELGPFEGMEYKYRLDTGDAFLYSWQSSVPVHVEMHSQADLAPLGYADSFELSDDISESHGSYTAPYPGIHGWYWENRTADVITVTITSVGFYQESQEFRRDMDVVHRPIE